MHALHGLSIRPELLSEPPQRLLGKLAVFPALAPALSGKTEEDTGRDQPDLQQDFQEGVPAMGARGW